MCVGFITHFAEIWFVRGMDVHVFLTITAVRKAPVTAFELTLERFFTCVCSFVDFQIFRSGKYFSTAGEWTRKRFLSRVNSDMIHKFIFCFKRFPFPAALFPKANVIRLLWSPNVLYSQMGHKLVHSAESFVAGLFRIRQLLWFDPFADELLLYGLSHVPKEGPCPVVGSHIHVHGAIAVQLSRSVVLGPGTRDMTVLLGPAVHVP